MRLEDCLRFAMEMATMVVEAEYSCPSAKACIIVVMENKNAKEVEVDAQVDNDLTETEKLKSAEKANAAKAEEKADTEEPKAEEPKVAAPVAAAHAVTVSGNATDDVHLSKCVYKNMFARKSLSVHHVQRRLVELGYKVVDSDKDGWYGDMTKLGVAQFQADNGYDGDGLMDARTLEDLFAGDRNITVVID